MDLIPAPNGSSAIDLVIAAALRQDDLDLDRVERFLDLRRKYEADEARKAYVQSMSEFKANEINISKDKEVSYSGTYYTHATLGNVISVVAPLLARHGFSHRWIIEQKDDLIYVTCTVTHKLGHSESVTMNAVKDDSGRKNAIQQVSSAVSYLERYTFMAVVGVAARDQDDDAQAASAPIDGRDQDWVDAIRTVQSKDELEAKRAAIIDDYRGKSNVPQVVREALVSKRAEIGE